MNYVNEKKYNPYLEEDDIEIGSGFEVRAYRRGNEVVKFFKENSDRVTTLTSDVIEELKKIDTRRILLPKEEIKDDTYDIRGYKMDYVENLGIDSLFDLDKEALKEEIEILKDDISLLSENNVLLEDLDHENTVYNNGIYMIDPGSYRIDKNKDKKDVYSINIRLMNEYLCMNLVRNYVLNRQKDFSFSCIVSSDIFRDYVYSQENNVLDYFSNIEEDSLGEYVDRKVNINK